MSEQGNVLIARTLTELGLQARAEDGWVFVTIDDGRELWIGAEYGASLDAAITAPPPAGAVR